MIPFQIAVDFSGAKRKDALSFDWIIISDMLDLGFGRPTLISYCGESTRCCLLLGPYGSCVVPYARSGELRSATPGYYGRNTDMSYFGCLKQIGGRFKVEKDNACT